MTLTPIDPFGYWPTYRSRITGLGGKEEPNDLSYVLHSPYVAVAPGPSVATVSFEGLAASAGLVEVSVFQRHAAHTPQITEAGKVGALLSTVVRTERPIRVPFEAIPGADYAVIGLSFGDLKARARGVKVEIGARSVADDMARERSQFGRLKARRVLALASSDRPSLREPVSQGFSAAQLDEEDFARWATWLAAGDLPTERWEAAYILRALESYGRLEPGARGLGLARDSDVVGAVAQNVGCATTGLTLRPDEPVPAALQRTFADPADGKGFDFLWTRGAVLAGLDPVRAASIAEDLLERVRPGGLAIYIFRTAPAAVEGALDSNALNRLALGLVANGHIVAQLRHDHQAIGHQAIGHQAGVARDGAPVPFGIIVRRAIESDG